MWMRFKWRHCILSELRALIICNHHYGVESVFVARQGHRQQLPGVIALVVPNLRREREVLTLTEFKKSSSPVDGISVRASSNNEGVVVTCRGMHAHADRKVVSCNQTLQLNRKHSSQLFVVVLYTCSVSYQLVSPSLAQCYSNLALF